MKHLADFEKSRQASRFMIRYPENLMNEVLSDLAGNLVNNTDGLLRENQKDLARMEVTNPKYDRLMLTPERIKGIAGDIRSVISLKSPVGGILEERNLSNGLDIKKVTVPIGVVGIIYEARPNVTVDVFSLCLKSKNVCLLKGGSDAENSNVALLKVIHETVRHHNMPEHIVQLLPSTQEATYELMNAVGLVDILIPRGGQSLIDFVRKNAKVPVIETGAGIVHTYFDASGDLAKGARIITNAKLRRVSVCNALDCLVIHKSRLSDLPDLLEELGRQAVDLYADRDSMDVLKNSYPGNYLHPATPEHFGTEFLSKKLAIKTVTSLDEALDHIARYSSKHSEAVISEDPEVTGRFLSEVDAAVVYANTSTAFTDGAQFGMGAEIGISTQKLHARGPMALNELTSYKWIVSSDGRIRPS